MPNYHLYIFIASVLGVTTLFAIITTKKRIRRKKLYDSPIPDEWINILKKNVPVYCYIPDNLKSRFHGLINIFIDEKHFEGCGGLEIDDTIKVTIAGQASILLINNNHPVYPGLRTILVYPSTYIADCKSSVGGLIVDDRTARLGESWGSGTVILAWDSIIQGAGNIEDAHNVVFHEFAHQLDQESGAADGIPILENQKQYMGWGKVFLKEFKELRYDVDHRIRVVMNSYGATNHAEFFAVATETFYEKPEKLYLNYPELYDALKLYYNVDPMSWKL